jgi:hypothetical protein
VFDTFSVSLKEESVDLHWSMLSEAEVAMYLVERAGSGIPFTPIAAIGPDMGSYSFQDAQPLQGRNHYRIRANAGNGLFEFSQTLSVPFPPPHGVQVFPNPTWNDVNFEFEYLRGSAYLQIFNLMGQLVHEESLEAIGPFVHQLDVRKFGAGLYSYRIDHSGYELLTGKFIIYTP